MLHHNLPIFDGLGALITDILTYQKTLKPYSQKLRMAMTAQERILWDHLRKKQICNTQFLRQKPIGNFIVDFYAPSVKLVIEVDGSYHLEPDMIEKDSNRDAYLNSLDLHVLRFENCQIEKCLDLVLIDIARYIERYQQPPSQQPPDALRARRPPSKGVKDREF